MASTGMSGTSDTPMPNDLEQNTNSLPQDTTADALGEPVGVVEVTEIEMVEPTPAGAEMLTPAEETTMTNAARFRWWMVPAVTVPVVAGAATATVILLRRRQQKPMPVSTYNKLARQSRDWLATVRGSQAAKSATKALQQGVESVRSTAQGRTMKPATWQDRANALLGTVAASAVVKQMSDRAKGMLDTVTSFWNANVPRAKQTVQEQGRQAPTLAGATQRMRLMRWRERGQPVPETAKAQAEKAKAQAEKVSQATKKAVKQAKPAATAALATTSLKTARAAEKANRATKRAGKRANAAMRRTRAFTFGMLVAALATYWRAWRQRLLEKETRETAGGRLVKA